MKKLLLIIMISIMPMLFACGSSNPCGDAMDTICNSCSKTLNAEWEAACLCVKNNSWSEGGYKCVESSDYDEGWCKDIQQNFSKDMCPDFSDNNTEE